MIVQDRNLLREKAVSLRIEGYSYSYIQNELKLPKSTLSDWLKMILFIPNKTTLDTIKNGTDKSARIRHQKRLTNTLVIQAEALDEIGNISFRDLWLFGVGLYLGEGTKKIESVRITNSDPRVIKIAVKWFIEVIGLSISNLTLSLHSYPDNDIDEDIEYWSVVSGIPISQFGKTQIDNRKDKHGKYKLPHGTVQLRVLANGNPKFGVSLHRRILGWIDAVAKQS